MPRILVVEDEVAIADALLFVLGSEGFITDWTRLAGEALSRLRTEAVDLVILDVGLPDMTGFEACKALRRFSDVPVMFLTARADEVDRIVGLEIGADDYVVKPFSPREVAARVRAILKRSGGGAAGVGAQTQTLQAPVAREGEFAVDEPLAQIRFLGRPLKLTLHEFRLLEKLLSQPRRVWSREQLLAVLGQPADVGYERNVDGHIKALRSKLREVDAQREPIQTHRGFGYSYQPAAQDG
ncbi:MAG: two-component system response regulator CreB [Nevskiaceae bacterium]|jgi:two-component system catabolic regulation response regulator CreB|nr:two-component system response regulator CreB [Nevskiaceae bacterium]